MWERFLEWREHRRLAAYKRRFDAGYRWAERELAEGEMTREDIEAVSAEGRRTAFDDGALAALQEDDDA